MLFKEGDQVSPKTSYQGTTFNLPGRKLIWKYMGPVAVSKQINDVAHELELLVVPRTWKAQIVFHVSQNPLSPMAKQ